MDYHGIQFLVFGSVYIICTLSWVDFFWTEIIKGIMVEKRTPL